MSLRLRLFKTTDGRMASEFVAGSDGSSPAESTQPSASPESNVGSTTPAPPMSPMPADTASAGNIESKKKVGKKQRKAKGSAEETEVAVPSRPNGEQLAVNPMVEGDMAVARKLAAILSSGAKRTAKNKEKRQKNRLNDLRKKWSKR